MDTKDLIGLIEAYSEVYVSQEELDEAEGSYGQTPKARTAMGKLAIARREKPVGEYGKRGEKTKKVKEIEKHTRRIDNGPDAGHSGGIGQENVMLSIVPVRINLVLVQ